MKNLERKPGMLFLLKCVISVPITNYINSFINSAGWSAQKSFMEETVLEKHTKLKTQDEGTESII